MEDIAFSLRSPHAGSASAELTEDTHETVRGKAVPLVGARKSSDREKNNKTKE